MDIDKKLLSVAYADHEPRASRRFKSWEVASQLLPPVVPGQTVKSYSSVWMLHTDGTVSSISEWDGTVKWWDV